MASGSEARLSRKNFSKSFGAVRAAVRGTVEVHGEQQVVHRQRRIPGVTAARIGWFVKHRFFHDAQEQHVGGGEARRAGDRDRNIHEARVAGRPLEGLHASH